MSEEIAAAGADLAHIARLQERLNHATTEAQAAIAELRAERDEARARAAILQAQLGSWEAQCAAQVEAAGHYLAMLSHTPHDSAGIGARVRLRDTIETDAGAVVLRELQAARALVETARTTLADWDTRSVFRFRRLREAIDAYDNREGP